MRINKILLSVIAVACMAACDKLPENSHLEGQWQLMETTYKGETVSVKDNSAYWSERLGLLQLSSPRNNVTRVYAHIVETADSLLIYDFCYPASYEDASSDCTFLPATDNHVLWHWGIHPVEEHNHKGELYTSFRKLTLTRSEMLLQNDSITLKFRKF